MSDRRSFLTTTANDLFVTDGKYVQVSSTRAAALPHIPVQSWNEELRLVTWCRDYDDLCNYDKYLQVKICVTRCRQDVRTEKCSVS